MRNWFYFVILSLCLFNCNSKEVARLKTENDSLRHELDTRYSVIVVMREVQVLLDSIDVNRKALRNDLDEGTTYENFSDRLKDINGYVKRSEEKITRIQKELKASKSEASAYFMMVDALKGELQIQAEEIAQLEETVATYKKENTGLVQTVKLQNTEMSELRTQIETKRQELSLIEAKVDELVDNFKVSEADSYYARAVAVEEAAKRTRLAPSKKKETYREALALYKKALSLGNNTAQAKITALEKKVK